MNYLRISLQSIIISRLSTPSLIGGIYWVVVTSQNSGDKAQKTIHGNEDVPDPRIGYRFIR